MRVQFRLNRGVPERLLAVLIAGEPNLGGGKEGRKWNPMARVTRMVSAARIVVARRDDVPELGSDDFWVVVVLTTRQCIKLTRECTSI